MNARAIHRVPDGQVGRSAPSLLVGLLYLEASQPALNQGWQEMGRIRNRFSLQGVPLSCGPVDVAERTADDVRYSQVHQKPGKAGPIKNDA